ncbi:MAG: HDOD domain-containing protein [Gammaproteobacteria bacterium]|nr:HDOD domain-containing protein [Gammaproteobacteria bacterium]
MNKSDLSPSELKQFPVFESLTASQIKYICDKVKAFHFQPNDVILQSNANVPGQFFLLEGSIKLDCVDSTVSNIKAGSPQAKGPIAQLRPSRYKVTAENQCKIIVVADKIMQELSKKEKKQFIVEEELGDTEQILFAVTKDIRQGKIELPSMPDIAFRIRELIDSKEATIDDIAKIVMTEPAITAKIIKVANSSVYFRGREITECKSAISVLGTTITSQYVTAFTTKELFKTNNKALLKYFDLLWKHSIRISSISFVIAKLTGRINTGEALLAGLLHDIGKIAIINKLASYPEIITDEKKINHILLKASHQISTMILESFNFPKAMITAAKEVENWQRDTDKPADLADVVNLAHIYTLFGSKKNSNVNINKIPVFKKIALGQMSPELTLQALKESNQLIQEIRSIYV